MIQQLLTNVCKDLGQNLMELFEGRLDLAQVVLNSQKQGREFLCQLIGTALTEMDDQLFQTSFRKQFYRTKAKRNRSLETEIGTVTFTRRYYEDKRSGDYLCLLDEMVGIERSSRLSLELKAALLTDSAHMSYRQAAKHHGGNSPQSATSVMQVVHHSGKEITALDQLSDTPRAVPETLFVEADEDHAPHQDGTNHFLKMVYVHEGYSKTGKKTALKQPMFVVGEYPGTAGTEELWATVLDCIDKQYGGQMPRRFFLAGDGATWIRTGAEYLPHCTVVYDKFHLRKACKQAAVGIGGDLGKILLHWALRGEKKFLKDYIAARLSDPALRAGERATLIQAQTLIWNNWDAIQANHAPGYHGCSAEGHVSHILADRFTSRPMGWSQEGADSLSQARVFVLKNGNVFEKLEENAKRRQKIVLEMRLDARTKRKRNAEIAKYAEVVSAQLVEQATGYRRNWQYGLTHGSERRW